jgi:hypothetical protein
MKATTAIEEKAGLLAIAVGIATALAQPAKIAGLDTETNPLRAVAGIIKRLRRPVRRKTS